ncbi:crooked neck-like protein 1 [Silurus asotus]|uniref:Crooked neck-like protein 1 n=1 Tax=Silurus asotus TaxID=30991 RepID=A0AAD5A500_SILAS|nr:crooked neck-like protein 1 [Silurus asotus]
MEPLQVIWKWYIDFEIEQKEYENARGLHKRLLQRTQHVETNAGWEDCYYYIFPEDAANQLKLLSMAQMWKKQQQQDQEKQKAEEDESTEPTQPRDEQ